jgi:hypothetical protein
MEEAVGHFSLLLWMILLLLDQRSRERKRVAAARRNEKRARRERRHARIDDGDRWIVDACGGGWIECDILVIRAAASGVSLLIPRVHELLRRGFLEGRGAKPARLAGLPWEVRAAESLPAATAGRT